MGVVVLINRILLWYLVFRQSKTTVFDWTFFPTGFFWFFFLSSVELFYSFCALPRGGWCEGVLLYGSRARQFFTVGACRRKRVALFNSPSVSCRIWFYLIKVGFHTPGTPIKKEQGIPSLLERGKPAPPAARSSVHGAVVPDGGSQPPPMATKLPQQLPQLTQLTSMTMACNGHQSWKAR